MLAEENLSKLLYKIELYLIKIIPIIIAFIYLLNTILSYFYIDLPILSYAVMGLLIMFLYISSYVFKFCFWHRVCILYIIINLVLNVLDLYIKINLSDRDMFILYMIIAGLCMFISLYLRFKKWTF